jgi:hypothetical protein
MAFPAKHESGGRLTGSIWKSQARDSIEDAVGQPVCLRSSITISPEPVENDDGVTVCAETLVHPTLLRTRRSLPFRRFVAPERQQRIPVRLRAPCGESDDQLAGVKCLASPARMDFSLSSSVFNRSP